MHVQLYLNGSIVRDNSRMLDLKRTFDPLFIKRAIYNIH